MPARERQGALTLGPGQRPGQERQVLLEREQDRPVVAQSLEHLDLERHGARHVAVCPAISPSPCSACMSPR